MELFRLPMYKSIKVILLKTEYFTSLYMEPRLLHYPVHLLSLFVV